MNENAIAKVPQALAAYDPEKYNLCLPVTSVACVPAGTMLSVREVVVDPNIDRGEVYPAEGGKLALGKAALDKISAAAGLTWASSRRIDDRTTPNYVEYEARGRVVEFDGVPRELVATKCIDLREDDGEGNPGKDIAKIRADANRAAEKSGKPADPTHRIMQARATISERAETGARHRVIRALLMVRPSYTAADLKRPFIVPKLILDTTDPDSKARVLDGMMGAVSRMYDTPRTIEAPQPPAIEAPKETPKQDPAVKARLADVWKIAKGFGCTREAFVALCKEETGKASSDDLTLEDVAKIEKAVSAEVDKRAATDEQVTF